ncbi:MAG: outer rane lipid asymmetry maintenance protein MlaD [Gammaproteobacteria bacterium]|nr:outer rane lipid asymmetry maintenance protein MlaD [Gammaproteobacteria bacterium]
MSEKKLQVLTGIFMVIGLICLSYLAIKLGELNLLGNERYPVIAKFTSASGLRVGAYVEAGGVRVGLVDKIEFDTDDYLAVVTMAIDNTVHIHEDAMASIRTAGIIGDKYVKITPGGLDYLEPGGEITETEPSINLEELISKYVFESGDKKK